MQYAYSSTDKDRISLHDCIASAAELTNERLIFRFPNGFSYEEYLNEWPNTGEAEIEITLESIKSVKVYLFGEAEGKTIREEYTIEQLVEKINNKEWELEFAYRYYGYQEILYTCWIWNKMGSGTYECELWIRTKEDIIFKWNQPKPEGSYCVHADLGFKLKEDRIYYMPGEHVEAVFIFVGTDMSYNVQVDAPDLKVEYGSIINVSFTMPDHDVKISISFRSVMMNTPNTPMVGVGFMGMVGNMNNVSQPDRAQVFDKPIVSDGSEWTCPLCGATNSGRFCGECGGVRP